MSALDHGGAVDRFKFARRMRFDLPEIPGGGLSARVGFGEIAVYAKVYGVRIVQNALFQQVERKIRIGQAENTVGKSGERLFPRSPVVVRFRVFRRPPPLLLAVNPDVLVGRRERGAKVRDQTVEPGLARFRAAIIRGAFRIGIHIEIEPESRLNLQTVLFAVFRRNEPNGRPRRKEHVARRAVVLRGTVHVVSVFAPVDERRFRRDRVEHAVDKGRQQAVAAPAQRQIGIFAAARVRINRVHPQAEHDDFGVLFANRFAHLRAAPTRQLLRFVERTAGRRIVLEHLRAVRFKIKAESAFGLARDPCANRGFFAHVFPAFLVRPVERRRIEVNANEVVLIALEIARFKIVNARFKPFFFPRIGRKERLTGDALSVFVLGGQVVDDSVKRSVLLHLAPVFADILGRRNVPSEFDKFLFRLILCKSARRRGRDGQNG